MFIKINEIKFGKKGNKLYGVFILDTSDMIVEFMQSKDYRQAKKSIDIRDTVLGKCSKADIEKLKMYNVHNRKLSESDTLKYSYDFYDSSEKARLLSVVKPSTPLLKYVINVGFTTKDGKNHAHNIYVGFECNARDQKLLFLSSQSLVNRVDDIGFILRADHVPGWIPIPGKDIIVQECSCPFNFIKQVFMEGNLNFLNSFFDGKILGIKDIGSFIDVKEALTSAVVCNL